MAASGELRQSANIGLVLVATVLAVLVLQWFVPEPTVVAATDRFLCDGVAGIDEQTPAQFGVLHTVECRRGVAAENMTGLALLLLLIPCAIVVGTGALLVRRVFFHRSRPSARLRPVHS